MEIRTFLCRLCVVPLVAAAFGAWAATPQPAYPEIEYASPEQSVWTTHLNANGEVDNPLKRVAEAIFAKAGMPWRYRTYPASRLFRYIEAGQSQFSILVRAPSLAECCLFSRKPIASVEIRVYRRAGVPPVQRREDLAGKQVIAILGYTYGGLAAFLADERNRIGLHLTNTHQSAFRMLQAGRADYVIDYAGPAEEVIAGERMGPVAFDTLIRQDVHLVLSKTYPDAQRVMERLETIAETLNVPALMSANR